MHKRNSLLVRVVARRLFTVTVAAGFMMSLIASFQGCKKTEDRNLLVGLPPPPSLDGSPGIVRDQLRTVEQLVRSAPSPERVAELGKSYHANGYAQEAEMCWKLLAALQPAEPKWKHYLADLKRAKNDQRGMADLLTEVVRLDPAYAPAHLQLANYHLKTGQLDYARRHFEQRLQQAEADPYATLGLARVAMQERREPQAAALLKQLVVRQPNFSPGHNLYSEILSKQEDHTGARWHRWLGREAGRFREAADPWLAEIIEHCVDPKRLAVLATIEFQTGNADGAKKLIDRMLRLDPNSSRALELLGDYHLKQTRYQLALDTFSRARRLAGDSHVAPAMVISLCEAYRQLGQSDRALMTAREILQAQPKELELHAACGVALSDLGRHEEAMVEFEVALRDVPFDAETNFNLAHSLLSLKREAEARRALERSLQQQPTFPKSLSLLGELELTHGRIEQAGKHIKALFEAYPGMSDARTLLAAWHIEASKALERDNRPLEAAASLRQGIDEIPDSPELQAAYGIICLKRKDWRNGSVAFEAYRQLKPNDAGGAVYLGECYLNSARPTEARQSLNEGIALAEQTGQTAAARRARELLSRL